MSKRKTKSKKKGKYGKTKKQKAGPKSPALTILFLPALPALPALRQHTTHLLLFFEPSFISNATVSGIGDKRCTGLLAMSAVV